MILPKLKFYLLAARPKTLTASLIPATLGAVLGYSETAQLKVLAAVCAPLSAICIQITTNYLNDREDFLRGSDTHERLGPPRMVQSGKLTPDEIIWGAYFFAALAVLFGVPLVAVGGLPILLIGIFSLVAGYFYTGGPYPLAYHGCGELFTILFFGIIAVSGSYFLHTGLISSSALLLGLQCGLFSSALISVNNFRDRATDAKANKRTLAVILGARYGELIIHLSLVVPFILIFIGSAAGDIRYLPLLGLPYAYFISKRLNENPSAANLNHLLAHTAKLHLLFGVLMAIALLSKQ